MKNKQSKLKEIEMLLKPDTALKELGFNRQQIAKIKEHQTKVGGFSIPIEIWVYAQINK